MFMPGGTGRLRPFFHCSSFKIIIRKTAWTMSLTLFNIPLADGDWTPIRHKHGKMLHDPPPFKDTESETLAVAPFEVSDLSFYCSEFSSKSFSQWSWCMISYFSLSEGIVISGVTCSFALSFCYIAAHKLAFLASSLKSSANPLIKF